MTYEELLKNAPAQDTHSFIEYLHAHNTIVKDYENFLVIENAKYHTPESPYHTAFWKHTEEMRNSIQFAFGLVNLLNDYSDWQWLKKATSKQTVKNRFHLHLIKQP